MHTDFPHRPTWAEIDLDALAFNMHSVRRFVGENIDCMAVVKADAYGHGAIECARRLEAEGTSIFAVATLEEGIELRDAGITNTILVLGGLWPGQTPLFLDHHLTPVLFTLEQAEEMNAAAAERGRQMNIHIKIDTGMGRVGFRWDGFAEVAERLSKLTSLNIDGMMSHFAVADDLAANDFTNTQLSRFDEAVKIAASLGTHPTYIDMANSPGAVAHSNARLGLVRLGGVLYGLGGDVLPAGIDVPKLKPVMSLRSRIAMIKTVSNGESIGYGRTFIAERDSVIATVPIGYHDGLSRALSNKGRFIINGKFAPVVGGVSMDWTTVDVTDIPKASVGDLVTIIGKEHECEIKAEDHAKLTDTISYEITCGIGPRVPRIYLGGKN